MIHNAQKGDRVAPLHYTREGYDHGTVVSDHPLQVRWDRTGHTCHEFSADLVPLIDTGWL